MRWMPVLLSVFFPAALPAADINMCRGTFGEPVYSDTGCGPTVDRVSLGRATVFDGDDMASRARQQRRRLQSLAPDAPAHRHHAVRRGLRFSEKAEMRGLRIRVEGLRHDLSHVYSDQRRRTLTSQLKAAEKRLRLLRRKAHQH